MIKATAKNTPPKGPDNGGYSAEAIAVLYGLDPAPKRSNINIGSEDNAENVEPGKLHNQSDKK